MGRSIAAVAVAFFTPAILVTITDAIVGRLLPELFPQPAPGQPYQVTPTGAVLNLTYGTIFAMLGGYLLAAIAKRDLMKHFYWLVGLMVVFGLVSMMAYAGQLPMWYSVVVVVLGIIGYYIGLRIYQASRGGSEPAEVTEPDEPA
jgi:hypothetical protein